MLYSFLGFGLMSARMNIFRVDTLKLLLSKYLLSSYFLKYVLIFINIITLYSICVKFLEKDRNRDCLSFLFR